MTFSDFKNKISIIEVAISLGYTFDKSKGFNQPSFVLSDEQGKTIDRIYIKNPKNNSTQGYWRRGYSNFPNEKGDLITFIKENLHEFSQASKARNEIDGINKVLLSFSNSGMTTEDIINKLENSAKIWKTREFNINRYARENGNNDAIMRIARQRGFDRETINVFAKYIDIIRDKDSKYDYKNIGFPYRVPGDDEIRGFEIRGYNGFKSKAEGTDSMKGAWIADFAKEKSEVRNIFFAESAYDAMAFYQINKAKINLENSVFVSTGGSFSEHQFKGISNYYSTGKPILLFDNDEIGNMYDIRAFALLSKINLSTKKIKDNVEFNINENKFQIPLNNINLNEFLKKSELKNNLVEIWKSPKTKDWNDIIVQKVKEEEIPNRYDFIQKKKEENLENKKGRKI